MISAAFGINFVHANFFKSQRLKLIDKQIAESSNALLNSPEFNRAKNNPLATEEAISKVLKGARIGKVFILRDPKGKIVYQSFNVSLLEADLPTQPEWVTVETDNEYVRVRNIQLSGRGSLTLQSGLVLDRNFINWEIIDDRVVNYVTGFILVLFLSSVLLTLILLSPLRLLIQHLKEATSHLVNLKDVQPLPKPLRRYTRGYWSQSDEFSSLLSTVQKLIDRINLNYKLTRSWTLQMAHELKTPLAIIKAETEAKGKAKLLPLDYQSDVIKEVQQMSGIIGQFLEWAELENSHVQKDLYAIRFKPFLRNLASRLEKISPGRLRLKLNSDFSVFTNPIHLDQLVTNLVSNALKFSPPDLPVELILSDYCLTVKDSGAGIPKEIRERLGEPFNVGSHEDGQPGHGLGLAWVVTVAKLYQWKFEIHSSAKGTEARLFFPQEETEEE